jgi:lysophospholipase L1-like esterase
VNRLLLLLLILNLSAIPENSDESQDDLAYDPKLNQIDNREYLEIFYAKLDSLVKSVKSSSVLFIKGQKKVNIVHIGDSHIQADYLSGETRKRLQATFGNGGRGFVFPYQVARSNGPIDVSVSYSGTWSSRNVLRDYLDQQIGASGFSVSCSDSSILSIGLRGEPSPYYGFNSLTIFEKNGIFYPEDRSVYIEMSGIKTTSRMNYSRYIFLKNFDSLNLIANTSSAATLHGLVFENKYPGIVYHSMGINGASTLQYLRSSEFEYQISELHADLVILSFGTNDCYLPSSRFCSSCVKDRYRQLIKRIRKQNPEVSILISTPPDSYYRKRYDNPNLRLFKTAMKELATELEISLWDLYSIMGGQRSIMNWYHRGLARADLIHFSERGYKLQGRLLYEAIIAGYEQRFN